MDAKLKKKWVAALRSGEYEQCRGKWRTSTGHCCLDVLRIVDGVSENDEIAIGAFSMQTLGGAEEVDFLIQANDEHGWTFDDIASYVEVMVE